MCDGGVFSVPIAMAVVGAAAAVHQGRQQAKAVEAELSSRREAINDKASQDANQRIAEVRALRAQARAAAAEAAVSGNSLAAIETDIEAQGGRDIAQIESNRAKGIESSTVEARARVRVAKAEAIGGVLGSAVQGVQNAYAANKINNTGGK